MPRILFVSGFHPSTRARDLAFEFERYVQFLHFFFPKFFTVVLVQQLRPSRTMRRTSTTQPTRKLQPVSVHCTWLQPLALSSRRVRSTDEAARCLRRPNTIRTRARPHSENVNLSIPILYLAGSSSSFAASSHRSRYLRVARRKRVFDYGLRFIISSDLSLFRVSQTPSNDRSIPRLVAMHSSNSAANATLRTLTTTCESPPCIHPRILTRRRHKARKIL